MMSVLRVFLLQSTGRRRKNIRLNQSMGVNAMSSIVNDCTVDPNHRLGMTMGKKKRVISELAKQVGNEVISS